MSSEVQVGYLFSKRNHGTMARSPHLPLPWKKSLLVACFRLFLLAEVGFLSLPFCTTSSFLVVSPKPQSQLKRLGKLLSVHLTFNPIPRSSELVPFWPTWCKLTGRIIPVDSRGNISYQKDNQPHFIPFWERIIQDPLGWPMLWTTKDWASSTWRIQLVGTNTGSNTNVWNPTLKRKNGNTINEWYEWQLHY